MPAVLWGEMEIQTEGRKTSLVGGCRQSTPTSSLTFQREAEKIEEKSFILQQAKKPSFHPKKLVIEMPMVRSGAKEEENPSLQHLQHPASRESRKKIIRNSTRKEKRMRRSHTIKKYWVNPAPDLLLPPQGGRHFKDARDDEMLLAAVVGAGERGGAARCPPPQSNGVHQSDKSSKMETAQMFRPDAFPMSGENFKRVAKALAGNARSTYNVLYHFHLLTTPRRWVDKLDPGQKNLTFVITKPEEWFESGAVGEFVAAIQTVPVLAVCVVRRLNVLKYLSLATYNGRVAIFSVRALEKVCPWREKVDLLPPEVRTWLADPDVVVVTSGERRTFLKKYQGIEVVSQIDTERIFQIYQEKGVIHPAVQAERGDLSWQLAYAIGYHVSPSKRNTWQQLIGENKYKLKGRDWPEWRMPGWQPDSVWRLNEQELFHLYFTTYGPHIFINRLLRHGLIYGGMEAVVTDVPLKDCYLIFLQGAMEEPELKLSNPLALHTDLHFTTKRDCSSPAVRRYNPQYAHLQTPTEKEEARRARMAAVVSKASLSREELALFPEQPSSTTGALQGSLEGSQEEGALEEGELVEEEGETVEIVEEEEEGEEPLQICVGDEDLALVDNNNNEQECREAPRRERKDNKPSKGKGPRRSDSDIVVALKRMAESSSPPPKREKSPPSREAPARQVKILTEKVRLPEKQRLLAHRLGPPVTPEADSVPSTSSAPPQHPGYFTARGWEEKQKKEAEQKAADTSAPAAQQGRASHLLGDLKCVDGGQQQALVPFHQVQSDDEDGPGPAKIGRDAPCYAPFDHRSRLMPERAHAGHYREEAKEFPPAPVAVIAPDRNLVLAARTARGPKPQGPARRRRDRKKNRKLGRRLLDHPDLTPEQVYTNPYVAAPIFDKRCSFCASWHCSRYLKGTRTLNCTCFKEQVEFAPTRRLCDYRRCGNEAVDHHTAVCPTLHARCTTCGCRGHTATHGCDIRDDRIMERFRYDFEECADVGVYTKKRFENLAWGFYPYPQSAPRNVMVVAYRRLSDLPVLAALGLLDSVLQFPENRPLPQGGVLESGHRLSAGGPRGGGEEDGDSEDWTD